MSPFQQFILALIVTNAGGEGKTMLAQLLHALWIIANQPVGLLDGDAGNHAARSSVKNAKSVGWGVNATFAPQIVSAMKGSHTIVDLGANTFASMREIVELLPALRDGFVDLGYRPVAFLPISTNKIAASGSLLELGAKLEGFDQIFVRVNRDLSGNFDPAFDAQVVVDLGHLAPGLQQYVRGPGRSLAEAVMNPPPGYSLAAAHVAYWMLDFLQQHPIAAIFGTRPAEALLAAYPEEPPFIAYQILQLADATDEALAEKASRTRILFAVETHGWTADGLRVVATLMDADAI
ncbi:MAG: hypothetical protein ACK4ZW_10305 [Blastomonas sp.]